MKSIHERQQEIAQYMLAAAQESGALEQRLRELRTLGDKLQGKLELLNELEMETANENAKKD